jgi:succinate-semialdehyde dehydrogenase/glutarate-semialdehyde dehydrogenase
MPWPRARGVLGGRRVPARAGEGHYYAPTVLAGATPAMELACEETFGPVVPVFRFADEAEVVAWPTTRRSAWRRTSTRSDPARIWRVADALETGIVGINEGALAAEAAPFGGVKESGYGREGSRHGLDDYLHVKYLCQGGLRF